MENIILTNNKDLRLVGVKVGVLSTLRFELPLVSASATHVEVIVTSGNVHSAYTATFIDATKRWQCDIAASQFPEVGKQSYEIAYVLDGKQFWDGKGWIEIEDATTSGIEPEPRPEPYRYVVVSVNGYGADAHGAVRIPKTFIATNSPVTTEGYMEGDIYFNRETGATWTLCDVQGTLTWVFNYKNYYTKAETEEAIDRVAAYYITYDAAGNPFPTYAALANATTVYSGGSVRVPTRNDYCVVLADETHDNAEYRYIYAVAEGETTGSWQPQFPVEGVMTVDQTVTKNSTNPVSGGGIWSAIWGALSALPTGFTSLYDWCVSQLAGKASKADATLTPLVFTEWTLTANNQNVPFDFSEYTGGRWRFVSDNPDAPLDVSCEGPENAAYLEWTYNDMPWSASRMAFGYKLGSQTDKPLASEAEAEALRTGKLDKTLGIITLSSPEGTTEFRIADTAGVYYVDIGPIAIKTNYPNSLSVLEFRFPSTSGTLALLQNLAPAFSTSATYAQDALCVYNGVLYRCTTAITTAEAWTAAHWTEATVEDVLAALRTGKANKVAGATAGNLAALDANGNPTDAGYHFEVRNGIPCIVQYT